MPSEKRVTNILYLIDCFTEFGAGTERHLVEVLRRLDRERFRPLLCTFATVDRQGRETDKSEGLPFEVLKVRKMHSWGGLLQAFRLRRLIRENHIDIVQTYHFVSDTYGVLVSRLSGVPIVISSRRDTGDLKQKKHVLLNRVMNRLIDHYIMVCDRVGEVNHEREGIPYRMMETVYNGVDLNRFAPNGKPRALTLRRQQGIGEDDFVLGTVAIFRPEKAYHVLLKAIEEIRPSIPNLRVLLIGKGPLEQSMRERCRQMGLEENVRFLGYVEDVERCLSLMDVFCLVPNSNEGFSNAIIEAMAAGRPVIATDVGGNAEAVVHGETGLIIPPDDPGALADAIVRLYRDESARLSMGRKGRERAEKEFDVEKMIINLQEIYDRLMGYRRDVPGNGNRPASLGKGREKEDRKEPSRSV